MSIVEAAHVKLSPEFDEFLIPALLNRFSNNLPSAFNSIDSCRTNSDPT